MAQYFEDTLVYDEAVLNNIKYLWKNFVKQPLLQVNIDQSLVLSKATALMNKSGSAPGMWIEKNNTIFISLPGVPYEMKGLMNDEVLPRISDKFNLPYILHKTLLTYGLGESIIAERIKDWEAALPDSVKLAYLPNLGRVRLRLSSKGYDKTAVTKNVDAHIQTLLPLINDVFVGFEEQSSIEQMIGNQLVKLGKTLAVAESCTGGKIAEQITANSGSSAYFKGGVVAYATETKIEILKVAPKLISDNSVVSSEVAEAMALNVKTVFSSDYGIATTGNAVDFGDLLLHMVTILQNNSDILARYQKRFKYILVDEYQDTNVAQYLWLRLLASSHQNICCVGDDDQSIYGWRGAEVGNILKFENDFKNS